jgi:hypothetical protein
MTLQEVIKKIGKDRIEEFLQFMTGQTVGENPDGSFDYYSQDVENFLREPKDRFFD